MRKFFITSSGTEIGKTLVTTSLAYQLSQKGERVAALKPVITGYEENDNSNDTSQLLASLSLPLDKAHKEAISPWRFSRPVAPNMAIAREGRTLPLDELVEFCQMPRAVDTLLVEGVGGVMVPLNEKNTVLDWMTALNWPVILVTGSYLGAISHTLTACEVIRSKGLSLTAVIVSESKNSDVDFMDTCHTLKKFLPYAGQLVALPRVMDNEKPWQDVADLTWML